MKEFIKDYLVTLLLYLAGFFVIYLLAPSSYKENFNFNVIYILIVFPILVSIAGRFMNWIDAGIKGNMLVAVLVFIICMMVIFLS